MVSLTSLWLPILVSAVIVFVASSIIHMVLPYHRSDMRKLAQEDEVLAALRRLTFHRATTGCRSPARTRPCGSRNSSRR